MILAVCAVLTLVSAGCGGSSSKASASTSIAAAADDPMYQYKRYDRCFIAGSGEVSSYYMIDEDAGYIRFFSTLPGLTWFEGYYSGDLENGIETDTGDGNSAVIRINADNASITADYSYGESYIFEECTPLEALTHLSQITGEEIDLSDNTGSDTPASTAPASSENTYILDVNPASHLIHTTECSRVSHIKESDVLTVNGTLEEILGSFNGYSVCENCHAQY